MIDIMQRKGIKEEIAWQEFWENQNVQTESK